MSAVCSPDGLLSPREMDTLNGLISFVAAGTNGFKKTTCGSHSAGYQVAVAIVNKMDFSFWSGGANAAYEFARTLLDAWGVGDPECNNGVVIFVSVEDRKMHISAGRGATAITDHAIQEIIDRMKPFMRECGHQRGRTHG